MLRHYERTVVSGYTEKGKRVREEVLHLRGQDPIRIAMRRNSALAKCGRLTVETEEAFVRQIDEEPWRSRSDIPQRGGGFDLDW